MSSFLDAKIPPDLIRASLKRALLLSAFFILFSTNSLLACQSGKLSEPVSVKFVYDGDTLYLKDQRKIRIIGMDTPEMGRHGKVQEPYAAEATEALRELLYQHHNQIRLQIGKDAYDRYGRQLAYVFLPDGTNVSEWMLLRGFATTLFIPPNLKYLDCYVKAERKAQNRQINIWTQNKFHLHVADLLDKKYTGYARLVAKVDSVKRNKRSIIINLRGGIRVKINQSNLHYFKSIHFDNLEGKRISVTGLIRKHGKSRTIYVKHPVYFHVM